MGLWWEYIYIYIYIYIYKEDRRALYTRRKSIVHWSDYTLSAEVKIDLDLKDDSSSQQVKVWKNTNHTLCAVLLPSRCCWRRTCAAVKTCECKMVKCYGNAGIVKEK